MGYSETIYYGCFLFVFYEISFNEILLDSPETSFFKVLLVAI